MNSCLVIKHELNAPNLGHAQRARTTEASLGSCAVCPSLTHDQTEPSKCDQSLLRLLSMMIVIFYPSAQQEH